MLLISIAGRQNGSESREIKDKGRQTYKEHE